MNTLRPPYSSYFCRHSLSSLSFSQCFRNGPVTDVPLIIGTMREEPDIEPKDIVAEYDKNQFALWLDGKLSPWGDGIGSKIITDLPAYKDIPPQQALARITADIRMLCGNLELAKDAYKGLGSSYPVYVYSMIQGPSGSFCGALSAINGFSYCPQYAFHLWDLFVFSLDTVGSWLWGHPLSKDERLLGETLRAAFLEFADTGAIQAWSAFTGPPDNDDDDDNVDDSVVKIMQGETRRISTSSEIETAYHFVNLISTAASERHAAPRYRERECAFFSTLGMENQACIN
mmetsp:Transcript_12056/g.20013  ORF Transcript_12056/g.20013 Transcript_12056/m.20013 type:complete len:287 (-) Transcript_12056:301-1161(-)